MLDELTPWLFSRLSGGVHWGLERTEGLLAGVGNPHRLFRSVLIGGTNGKGSVAALAEAALREHGQGSSRVGLYTSPHLISFNERIRIDGAPVAAEVLAELAVRLRPAIEETGASFFEATTAMAFLAFAEAGVDLAVVEVGLGGRLDSTNVLDPMATAVTNISLDHSEYLGTTLEEIAVEKAGIFSEGVPALSGEVDSQVAAVLKERADMVGAPFHQLDEIASVTEVRTGVEGTTLSLESAHWGRRELWLPLIGAHQARNAAMAAELLRLLPPDVRPTWPAVAAGFARVRWPGRLQLVEVRGTTWLFDVAHNRAGAESLALAIDALGAEIPRPIAAVVGILRDKEWREMLSTLDRSVDAVVLTTPPTAPPGRLWDVEAVGRWSAENVNVPVTVVPDFAAALDRATALGPHGTMLVTGSVHTVGDAMKILEVNPV